MRVKVVGLKRWRGTLEGKAIDSAKLYVETRLDDSRNGDSGDSSQFAAGLATEELRLPNGEHVRSVEKHALPFWAEVSTERVTNGRTAREVVTGVRYLADVDGVAPAPVAPLKRA